MDGDKESFPEPLRKRQSGMSPTRGKQMVGFFKNKPMRPTDTRTHRLQIQEEFSKKMRAIDQRDTQEIHIYVHIRVLEYSKNFVDTWDASLISDCHETLNGNVITLRVHDADLIGFFNKTFNKTGSQC